MADITKLKHKSKTRNALGGAQPPVEASSNLDAPEVAPKQNIAPDPLKTPTIAEIHSKKRIDGRKLRKTGRTIQFSTRVTPEFDTRIREIAQEHDLKIVEVLELALESYEKEAN